MLTQAQWAAVEDAVHRVCNRESDYEPIKEDNGDQGALVQRVPGDHIRITIRSTVWDLEPDREGRLDA